MRGTSLLVEPPRVKQREISPWSLKETLLFLEAARRDPLYAAFVLAVCMGLRRGELVGLRWSDVDLDNRVLHVRHQTQRAWARCTTMTPRVGVAGSSLCPLCVSRRCVGTGCGSGEFAARASRGPSRIRLRHEERPAGRAAQRLPVLHPGRCAAGLRVVRLHDARHGCATLLTAAGVAPRVIMEILGHSQISITMDVYTHVVHDTQREAISHMDRLLKRQLPGVERGTAVKWLLKGPGP